MAVVGSTLCCRRRGRGRPIVQFLLVAFCLFNFAIALVFFQRMYRSNEVDDSEQSDLSSSVPFAASSSLAIESTPQKFNAETVVKTEAVVDGTPQVSHVVAELSADTVNNDYATAADSRISLGGLSASTDSALLELYEKRAKQPAILNRNLLNSNIDVVVVVQVHDRASYLAYLFDSFRRVPSWNGSVIVLSHDFYSAEIDLLVKNCTFAPIIDIYYPVPMQIFKERYPGEDPRDCTRDMNQETAKKQGCHNANYPDTYGHYREARFSQTKHHWIWKLHYIFDYVIPGNFPKFSGPVLLLEEDHYVSPDFLHVLRLAWQLASTNFRIVTIGNYKDMRFGNDASHFAGNKWVSSRLNMGMSMTASTWKLIQACVKTFCDFDDYNWDWSLQFTAIQCIEGNLLTLYARSSRVFHVGECAGIHFKNKCIASEKVESIKQMLADNADSLFPAALTIEEGVAAISQLRPKANGGWGDPRDRVMCRSLASGSFIEILKSVDRAQTEPI